VVYVRPGHEPRRAFRRACKRLAIGLENPDGADDTRGAFVAYGLPAALRQLCLHWFVTRFHMTTDQRPPRAAGAGKIKPRSKAEPPAPPPLATDKERRGIQGLR
jgi:hypothetical protein